jgi:hypothetical protein
MRELTVKEQNCLSASVSNFSLPLQYALPPKSPISLDYYPKTNKNSLIFMSENLEFQCAINRADNPVSGA